MSYSILQEPRFVEPVYNQITFTVDSSNKTECKFKYKSCIYMLECPISGEPKYIGQTIDLKRRSSQHLYSLKNKCKKTSWVKNLKAKGLKPIITILEECKPEELNFWETHYISLYRSWGFNLKNHDLGGNSHLGRKASEETKLKMSLARKGKRFSEEHKAKIGLANKGKVKGPRTEETINKISKANKGKSKPLFTEEHKRKIGLKSIGRVRSKESIEKGLETKKNNKLKQLKCQHTK